MRDMDGFQSPEAPGVFHGTTGFWDSDVFMVMT